MISAQQLTKRYGQHVALDQLTLNIAPGEIFCLLGQNGAGKTTTINCFLGFTQPTSGKAFINGLNVSEHPIESKRYIAYLPEVVMLYPNLTGLENLDYFSRLAGFKHSRQQLKAFLADAGLVDTVIERRIGTYSKGMRQKTGIAIAIAKQAKALFLDEPTSGLDPKASNEFSQLMQKMAANGVAVLMATHDLFRAKEMASRVGIMREGQLVATYSAADFSPAELEQIYLQTV